MSVRERPNSIPFHYHRAHEQFALSAAGECFLGGTDHGVVPNIRWLIVLFRFGFVFHTLYYFVDVLRWLLKSLR